MSKSFFKKIRPFLGLLLMIVLILMSSVLVFFSVASGLVLPLLWMIFTALHQFKQANKKITYLWNATRFSMWIYFSSIFMLLIWTPEWVKVLSVHLERRSLVSVFQNGSIYMYGRMSVAFALAIAIFLGFLLHYRWTERKEKMQRQKQMS